MNDSLGVGPQTEKLYPVLFRISLDRLHHLFGEFVFKRAVLICSRYDMVNRGKRPIRPQNLEPTLFEHLERLGGGYLMDEVQPDEKLILPGFQRSNLV